MLALIDHDRVLTHTELARRAAWWAAALHRRHGVGPGDRVAVLADNHGETFVLLAACARLGAALAPLSWRLAPAEFAAIVADCAPTVLLHDAAHADAAAALAVPCARLDRAPPQVAPLGARELSISGSLIDRSARREIGGRSSSGSIPRSYRPLGGRPARAGAIAQVLYTSGTTGRPRGVLITHRQIAFNAAATATVCALGPGDRVLGLLPLFHTGGLNCLATPVLAAGGAVVTMARFDAAAAVARCAADGITALIAVPTIYEQLLDAGLDHRRAPALRTALIGGAPVTAALRARAHAAGLTLRQGFGMTEVGPNCFTLGDDDVGKPVPGTAARVVDGELWLRGPHVAAGYLGQTAPIVDAAGWFHTGDRVRQDDDGRVTVVGRQKDMFISGGENVYLAEVEAVLAAHPAVVEAAVIGVADPRWGEVGLAVVVARQAVDADALASWTRARLAAFKVPRHWRFVAALPRTATGKLSRAALAGFAADGAVSARRAG